VPQAQGLPLALPPQPVRIPGPRPATTTAPERLARRELRAQIARLERELARSFVSAFPHGEVDVSVPAAGGPRLLSLGELETTRDALSARLSSARRSLADLGERQERARVMLERMRLEPGRYKFARVSNAELGEGGCGVWEVRPRLGLIGMLAGWWQVKLSSGCPLGRGRGPAPPPRRSAVRLTA